MTPTTETSNPKPQTLHQMTGGLEEEEEEGSDGGTPYTLNPEPKTQRQNSKPETSVILHAKVRAGAESQHRAQPGVSGQPR